MMSASGLCVLSGLDPLNFVPHAVHGQDRNWPETNCYTDLWIEILNARGLDPRAALAFTAAQDFEGDHFTFFKYPLEDLEAAYGLSVQELSIFDRVETHIAQQMQRGRLALVEVDSFYLPDTRGVSYQLEHTKTTIAINRLDVAAREVDYFHNAGYFTASGDDYDGIFQKLPHQQRDDNLFPYVEFVKFGTAAGLPQSALLAKHLAKRPATNPLSEFAKVIVAQVEDVAAREPAYFHKYAFNTLRQVGANFELLAAHLQWMGEQGESGLEAAIASCEQIASSAKAYQFQLARAVARKKFEPLVAQLEPMIAAYDSVMNALSSR